MSYFVVALFVLIVLIVIFLRRKYGTLEKCGFPVIPPAFVLGSGPWSWHKVDIVQMDLDREAKYGKVYGSYVISEPWVTVGDPDLIKQIMIKNFDSFQGHSFVVKEQKHRSLDLTSGHEWSVLRKGLSPIFSSGKIKAMLSMLGGSVDNMMDFLDKRVEEDPVIDMKPVFQKMGMDVIGKVCFGLELNCFNNTNERLLQISKEFVTEITQVRDWKTNLMMNMYMGLAGIEKYVNVMPSQTEELWQFVRKVEERRKSDNTHYGDFIDKLAELKEQIKEGKMSVVTEDQITMQGVIFLLAGHETTANTLGSLCYHLVKNAQAYENLRMEVDAILDKFDGRVDHETIADMPFLEGCLKETLRLCPPVMRNDRHCNKEFTYNGVTIPADVNVFFPVAAIHLNPEYWPEPYAFKPERFFKENADKIVPCSWIPFGAGPRACIGERFSMVEMKIAIVRLLERFDLQITDKTRFHVMKGEMDLLNYTDMFIHLVKK